MISISMIADFSLKEEKKSRRRFKEKSIRRKVLRMPSWLQRVLIGTCSHGVSELFTPSYQSFRFSWLFAHLCEVLVKHISFRKVKMNIWKHHPTAFRKIRSTQRHKVENSRHMIEKHLCDWISYLCYISQIGQHSVDWQCYLQRNVSFTYKIAVFWDGRNIRNIFFGRNEILSIF